MHVHNDRKAGKLDDLAPGSLFAFGANVGGGLGFRCADEPGAADGRWVSIGPSRDDATRHPRLRQAPLDTVRLIDLGRDFVVWLSPSPSDLSFYEIGVYEPWPVIAIRDELILLRLNGGTNAGAFEGVYVDLRKGDLHRRPGNDAVYVSRWKLGLRTTLEEDGLERAGVEWIYGECAPKLWENQAQG